MVVSESTRSGLAATCGGPEITEIPPPWPGGVSPHPQGLRIAHRVGRRRAGAWMGQAWHAEGFCQPKPYAFRASDRYEETDPLPQGIAGPDWTRLAAGLEVESEGESKRTTSHGLIAMAGDCSELSPNPASCR